MAVVTLIYTWKVTYHMQQLSLGQRLLSVKKRVKMGWFETTLQATVGAHLPQMQALAMAFIVTSGSTQHRVRSQDSFLECF